VRQKESLESDACNIVKCEAMYKMFKAIYNPYAIYPS